MSTTPSTTQLQRTLHRANRALRATGVMRTAALAAAMLLAAAMAAVVIDAVLGLNTVGLIAGNAMMAALLLIAGAVVVRTLWRTRYDARRVARFVERQAGLRDSRLINAVDFADGIAEQATSPTLRAMAISEGDRLAAGVEPGRLVDRRPALRAMAICAAALVVIVLAAVAIPRLFAMVLPRYLDPTGDHPPFTLVDFDVVVTPDKVYHGRRATITATLSGPIVPQEATVVFVDDGGVAEASPATTERTNEQRLAMMMRSDGRFELPVDRATASRMFYIDTPHGRSRRHTLTVLPVPTFEKATVRYEYPEYTGWPPSERPLDEAGIAAIVGTRITVSIDSNLPLGMGFVTITPDTGSASDEATVNLAPAAEKPTNVAGSFTLTHSGVYTLWLRAADGTTSDTAPTGPINAIADAPPRVSLVEPDLRLIAPAGWKVAASFSAGDDVGVDRITMHVLRGDSEPIDAPLDLKRPSPNRATGSHTIDLAAIDAKPGEVIKGFATAYDNRPGVAQAADSPTFEIHVVSAEEYADLARQQVRADDIAAEMQKFIDQMKKLDEMRAELAAQAEQLRKDLAEQNAGEANADPASPTDQQKADNATKTAELAKGLDEYAKRAADLAERLQERAERDPLYEFEKPVQEDLARTASEMAKQSAMAAGHRDRLPPATTPKLDALLRDLKRADDAAESRQAEQQLTQQQLEKLAKAEAMMAAASQIVSIAELQRAIADRLNAARAATDALAPEHVDRMQRLADEQDAVRELLETTLTELADAAEEAEHELPKMAASADDLVRKVREMKVTGDQREAADHARVQAAGLAYMAADAAATKLESLIGECNSMCKGGAMDQLDGTLSLTRSQLANALAQMAQARRGDGKKFGPGSGNGAGGQAGSQLGPGGAQTGGEPSNTPGTLVGPHIAQRGKPSDRVGDSNSKSDAFNRADRTGPDQAPGHAEHIAAQSRDADRQAPRVGDPDAAPLRYRPLIDAYFKRLADDSK